MYQAHKMEVETAASAEARCAVGSAPSEQVQKGVLMAGRKRNNEEASPIGCEGEDYVLKGSTNSELLYNAVRWIGMILQVSDGKGWNTALTNTQIAATMDLAVFDAISDKFPKKEPEQFSVSAKRLLDMMLSKGQKAALEILHEMKALFTKPNTHLRMLRRYFSKNFKGLSRASAPNRSRPRLTRSLRSNTRLSSAKSRMWQRMIRPTKCLNTFQTWPRQGFAISEADFACLQR